MEYVRTRVPKFETHSHEQNQENEYKQFNLETKIKLRCQGDGEDFDNIFEEEHKNENTSLHESPLSLKKLKPAMYKNRTKNLPTNPMSLEETTAYFANEFVQSCLKSKDRSTNFFQQMVSNGHYTYIVFVSEYVLQHLPENRWFHITNSMNVTPNGFFKVFITFAIVNDNKSFPCIFAMMTHREQKGYQHLLHTVEDNWNLNITKAWVDYDRYLRQALVQIYPSISIKAFWYQYCLAVRRKSKKIPGFFEFLWGNETANVLYHQFLCLPLMNADHIRQSFDVLNRKAGAFEQFHDLIEYFNTVWLRREGPINFAVEWDLFSKPCSENYNKELKQKFVHSDAKSSLFYFLKLIQQEESSISKRYMDYQLQSIPRDESNQRNSQNSFIISIRDNFDKGKIDIGQFFQKLTFYDNTGCIKHLSNYTIGDENDFHVNDDHDYEIVERNWHANNAIVNEEPAQVVGAASEEASLKETCVVCLTTKRDTMLVPCNHFSFCEECVKVLMNKNAIVNGVRVRPTCPLCRRVIEGLQHVFM